MKNKLLKSVLLCSLMGGLMATGCSNNSSKDSKSLEKNVLNYEEAYELCLYGMAKLEANHDGVLNNLKILQSYENEDGFVYNNKEYYKKLEDGSFVKYSDEIASQGAEEYDFVVFRNGEGYVEYSEAKGEGMIDSYYRTMDTFMDAIYLSGYERDSILTMFTKENVSKVEVLESGNYLVSFVFTEETDRRNFTTIVADYEVSRAGLIEKSSINSVFAEREGQEEDRYTQYSAITKDYIYNGVEEDDLTKINEFVTKAKNYINTQE